jgi:hypothetical protein
MFGGLVIMSSKSVVCISLRSSFSFLFDDFDTINLAPRHISLHFIKLNKKMEINDVLRIDNKFHPNSLNVLHEFVMIILWVCVHFGDTNFERKEGGKHACY